MALTTSNVRVKATALRTITVRLYSYLLLEEWEGPLQPRRQLHVITRVGAQDIRHRAGVAQLPSPC